MRIRPMLLAEAKEICQWGYEGKYSLYNLTESPETLAELMDGTYYAVQSDQEGLIGFFCFGANAQVSGGRLAGVYNGQDAVDIGLGLRPDLTGKGRGSRFIQAGIDFAIASYRPSMLRLSVAAFNRRAIAVYQHVGFIQIASFLHGGREFGVMVKEVSPSSPVDR